MAVDWSKLRTLAQGVPILNPDTLTAKATGSVNTGDSTSDGVIENNRTRIDEIETALVDIGVLKESGS